MSRRFGKYDANLSMFVQEEEQPINLNRLGFLRWLIERGRLEHPAAGQASGPLVAPPPVPLVYLPPEYTGKAA